MSGEYKKMGTEKIFDRNCKHKWIKKVYNGYGVVATWDFCPKCMSEKNRYVKEYPLIQKAIKEMIK